MAGKILKSILLAAIAVLLSSFLLITGLLYQDFTRIQHEQLKNELLFAAAATEQLGTDYLKTLPADYHRLTWISSDGRVLYDGRADSKEMENHSDREEIREAIEYGAGSSSRYSSTLTEKTVYEAVQLSDGSILRISLSSDTIAALAIELLYPIAFIAAAAILFSIWLARRMAKQVMEPLNRLNLDQPLSNNTYEELTPLLQRISSQHQEIQLQMQLLKRRQQEFDQITDNMKEVLVLLDAEQRILSMNPAAIRLFEMSPSCEGQRFVPQQYGEELNHAIQNAKNNGRAEFTAAAREREYLFNVSCIASDSLIQGIVILAFDVTEQMNAERSRRDFTSNVSHELKTPLQSIIGSAELIENGIVKPEDLPRFVGHIRKEASRLVKLIEDIIRLAQLDEGSPLPAEEVSLYALSEEVREVLLPSAAEKNIAIQVSGSSGTLYGIPSLLFELIYNLTDNAVRYNRENGSVSITVSEEDDRIQLYVKDTGIGIPPEHHTKIFERFYRVDKSHSRISGGTGLGLSIVKHAVKYHHGTIHLDSTPGQGTCICVTLQK